MNARRVAIFIAASLIAVSLLVATRTPGDVVRSGFAVPATSADMVGYRWALREVSEDGGRLRRTPDSWHTSIWLPRNGEAAWYDGVNSTSTGFTTSIGRLSFGPTLISTLVGYGRIPLALPRGGVDIGTLIIRAYGGLGAATSISAMIEDGRLVLTTEHFQMVFNRAETLTT